MDTANETQLQDLHIGNSVNLESSKCTSLTSLSVACIRTIANSFPYQYETQNLPYLPATRILGIFSYMAKNLSHHVERLPQLHTLLSDWDILLTASRSDSFMRVISSSLQMYRDVRDPLDWVQNVLSGNPIQQSNVDIYAKRKIERDDVDLHIDRLYPCHRLCTSDRVFDLQYYPQSAEKTKTLCRLSKSHPLLLQPAAETIFFHLLTKVNAELKSGIRKFETFEEAMFNIEFAMELAGCLCDLIWDEAAIKVCYQCIELIHFVYKSSGLVPSEIASSTAEFVVSSFSPSSPAWLSVVSLPNATKFLKFYCNTLFHVHLRVSRAHESFCQFQLAEAMFLKAFNIAKAAEMVGVHICTTYLISNVANHYFALCKYQMAKFFSMHALREMQYILKENPISGYTHNIEEVDEDASKTLKEIVEDTIQPISTEVAPNEQQEITLTDLDLTRESDMKGQKENNTVPADSSKVVPSWQLPSPSGLVTDITTLQSSPFTPYLRQLDNPIEQQRLKRFCLPVNIVIDILRHSSRIHVATRNYSTALKYVTKARELVERNFSLNHTLTASVYSDYAYYLINKDEVELAIPALTQAMNIKKKIYGVNSLHTACLDADMGYALYVKNYSVGKFEKAEFHALRSIKIRESLLPTDHILIAFVQRVLGLIYEEMGIDSHEEAERDRLFALSETLQGSGLQACMDVFGEESLITAKYYGNMGRLYQTLHRFEESEIMHLKAIQIKEKVMGENDFEVSLSLGHLASLYCYDMSRYADAERLYLRAISIGVKLFGEMYSGLEYDYNGLIHLYECTGNLQGFHNYVVKLTEWQERRQQRETDPDTLENKDDNDELGLEAFLCSL